MKLVRFFLNYISGIIGILLISAVPVFFKGKPNLHLKEYFTVLYDTIQKIINPDQWVIHAIEGFQRVEKPIFSAITDSYLYSMKVLLGGIFLGFIVALIFAFITFVLPNYGKEFIKKIVNVLESFPDVIFIFLFQMFIVFVYKLTGHLMFEFVVFDTGDIYAAPIISISILPCVLFFKVILLLLEEEWSKDYIVLAKSKGLKKLFILYVHTLRNIAASLFFQSKHIVWAALSSLIIIEMMFMMKGIMRQLLFDHTPFVFTVILSLIFTPFYFIYNGVELYLNSKDKKTDQSFSLKAIYKKQAKGISLPKFVWSKILKTTLVGIVGFFKVLKDLLKKPKFLFGFSYMLSIFVISVVYVHMKEEPITKIGIFGPDGKVVGKLPHPPSDLFILGSDHYGYSIFDQIIVGAKYTVIFILLIAFLRVALGYLIAIPYLFYFNAKWQNRVKKIADGIHYLPLSMVAYVILSPFLIKVDDNPWLVPYAERLGVQVLVLTVLVLPIMVNVIGSELNKMAQEDYIQSSILMGACKARILFKHLTPNLLPRFILLFQQQVTQVIAVLIGLGFFKIFLGGTIVHTGHPYEYSSVTHEWSGMIANGKDAFMYAKYWLVVPAFIVLILFIWSVQGMTQEIINYHQSRCGVVLDKKKAWWKKRKKSSINRPKKTAANKEKFDFINPPII